MAKFGIGQAVRRVEDQRFLLGQGRYVDDISLPGQCYGVTVVNLEDAAKDGAAKVWDDCPQGNVGFRLMFGNKDATDTAFAKARHVVKLRVENNRLSPVAMEPRVAIGDYNASDDSYTLYTASQNPHGVRMEMSHIFHVPENRIRVVAPDVGGGFRSEERRVG